MVQAMKPHKRRARLCSALTTIVRSSRNCTSFSEGLGSSCPKPSIAPSLGSVATTKRCAARPSGFMLRARYRPRAECAPRVTRFAVFARHGPWAQLPLVRIGSHQEALRLRAHVAGSLPFEVLSRRSSHSTCIAHTGLKHKSYINCGSNTLARLSVQVAYRHTGCQYGPSRYLHYRAVIGN